MRILFISSHNMIAADVSRLLSQEKNEVKLYIADEERRGNFKNIVGKTANWEKELKWVGKSGLIVFDDVGYGKIQDELRELGYSVFGGCRLGDKLELDRAYAQKILRENGLQFLETHDFSSIDACIKFLSNSKKSWVLKQNDHKLNITTISKTKDNCDVLDMLQFCKKHYRDKLKTVTLQERVQGVEVGVGRFFNGKNWIGPIEIAFEHKRFLNGDLGPMTTEMGTLAWFDGDDNNILFQKTIAKMESYLRKIQFKGDFQVNFIINGENIYPLEVTTRFGSPEVYLQSEFQYLKWTNFINAAARGKNYDVKFKSGYGLVVLLATPPFPYVSKLDQVSLKGVSINFDGVNQEEFKHIFFEGVAKQTAKQGGRYFISDGEGYVLYVTGVGKTVKAVHKKVYDIINKIHIPRCLYRTDIGLKFIDCDYKLLCTWGYLK